MRSVGTGRLANTTEPRVVTDVKASSAGVSGRITFIRVVSTETVWWTKTRGTNADTVDLGSASALE